MKQNSHITTGDVARKLGLSLNTLGRYLSEHPHLRPEKRIGITLIWTQAEIDRLIEFRGRVKSKGGRPKGAKNKSKPSAQESQ